MEVEFWGATDTGRQRDHNEDNFLVDKELGLFVVCDGMGGHAAGEVASAIGVQTIRNRLQEARDRVLSTDRRDGAIDAEMLDLLDDAVREANARIFDLSNRSEAEGGMGTTCSLLLVRGRTGFVAHVGDSRIYRCRRQGSEQITDDHSLRNRMIQEGRLDPDEEFSQSNAVTRAVGMNETLEVETFTIDLRAGDRLLMCSDGLYDHFETGEELLELTEGRELRSATERCIDFANQSGGDDNVTVLMLSLEDGEGVRDVRETTPAAEAIRQLPHFDHLSSEARGDVEELAEVWTVEADVEIVEADDPQSALFVVVDGGVEVQREGDRLERLGAGEHFGEMALLGRSKPGISAETRESSTLLRLGRTAFYEYLRLDRERALKVLWNMLNHFADKLGRLSYEAFRRPEAPLAESSPDATEERGRAADDSTELHVAEGGDSDPPAVPDGARRTSPSLEPDDGDDRSLPSNDGDETFGSVESETERHTAERARGDESPTAEWSRADTERGPTSGRVDDASGGSGRDRGESEWRNRSETDDVGESLSDVSERPRSEPDGGSARSEHSRNDDPPDRERRRSDDVAIGSSHTEDDEGAARSRTRSDERTSEAETGSTHSGTSRTDTDDESSSTRSRLDAISSGTSQTDGGSEAPDTRRDEPPSGATSDSNTDSRELTSDVDSTIESSAFDFAESDTSPGTRSNSEDEVEDDEESVRETVRLDIDDETP